MDRQLYQYLPATHQRSRVLRELLQPFEEHLGELDTQLSAFTHEVNPSRASTRQLRWLASWVDLILEEDWDENKRRRLISHAIQLYRRRGTARGLEEYLAVYTGLKAKIMAYREPGGFQIGFSSRIGGFRDPRSGIWVEKPWKDRDEFRELVLEEANGEGVRFDCYIVTDQVGAVSVYRADKVREVKIEVCDPEQRGGPLAITIETVDGKVANKRGHIVRRDGLPGPRTLCTPDRPHARYQYEGDTILWEEKEAPFSFVVELSGPSLRGVLALLAAERERVSEALLTGSSVESRLESILEHLQDDVQDLVSGIVKTELPAQAARRAMAGDGEQAEHLLREELPRLLKDDKVRNLPKLEQQTAEHFCKELSSIWCRSDEDVQGLVDLLHRPVLEVVAQIHLAEVFLREWMRLAGEEPPRPATEIERYLDLSGAGLAADGAFEAGGAFGISSRSEPVRRVRAVLDREKPVHSRYFLRFRVEDAQAPTMRIGMHSTIGASTVIG